ncbi:mCG141246, partial [Mus musculus]
HEEVAERSQSVASPSGTVPRLLVTATVHFFPPSTPSDTMLCLVDNKIELGHRYTSGQWKTLCSCGAMQSWNAL